MSHHRSRSFSVHPDTQLVFQVVYATTEGLNETVLFAFSASLLSVVFSILSYCIDNDQMSQEMVAVNYYLALERQGHGALGLSLESPSVSPRGVGLRTSEKLQIDRYRGWRQQLSRSLTELWQIPEKSIEIGNTLTTNKGAITHIVHLMKREDIEDAQHMFGDAESAEIGRYGNYGISIAEQFYAMKRDAVNKIFRAHFRLRRQFQISFYCRSEKTLKMKLAGDSAPQHVVPLYSSGSFMESDGGQNRLKEALREYLESGHRGNDDGDWMEAKRAEVMKIMEGLAMANGTVAKQQITTPGNVMEIEMAEYNDSTNRNVGGIGRLEGMEPQSISNST